MIHVQIKVDVNDLNFIKCAYLDLDNEKQKLYSYSIPGYDYNRIYVCLEKELENPITCDIRLSVFSPDKIPLETYSKLDQIAIYNASEVDIVVNKICIKANEIKCLLQKRVGVIMENAFEALFADYEGETEQDEFWTDKARGKEII